jgi:hypothetical protein
MKKPISKKPDTTKDLKKKANIYIVLLLITLGLGGYFGYVNYQEFRATEQALVDAQTKLEDLQVKASKSSSDFSDTKSTFQESDTLVNSEIQKVFPSSEDYTQLARDLDLLIKEIDTTDDPIFLSDLKFDAPEIKDDAEFAVLPIAMTLTATDVSFKTLLERIEASGDLKVSDRVMDIQSISLSFGEAPIDETGSLTGEKPKLNVALEVNAYYQKPKTTTK